MLTELTEAELDIITSYTGMDMAMQYSLAFTPVVYFGRDDRGVVKFVTVLRESPIGSESLCNWEMSGV